MSEMETIYVPHPGAAPESAAAGNAHAPPARQPCASRRAAGIALAGAGAAGALAEGALRDGPPGLGLTVATLALLLTLALATRARDGGTRHAAAYAVPALFALLLSWRASDPLQVLNIGATLLSLGLLAYALAPARRWPLRAARPLTIVWAARRSVMHAAVGAPALAAAGYPDRGRAQRAVGAAVRALLIAAPVVALFGALLAGADDVFARWLARVVDVGVEDFFWHSVVAAVLAWGAAGYLRGALLPSPTAAATIPRAMPRLSTTDVVVMLGTLDLLFLAFAAVQFRHLFAGAAVVADTPGLTYSDYARRGFFELVWVTVLALPLLVATHEAVPRAGRTRSAFRWLATPMLALLLVVVLSALRRMQLYQAEFGLTVQRVYATALMLWVAALLALFAATVLRGRARGFAWRALLSGAVALVALNAVNPEALIVRTNVRRGTEAHRVDVAYLVRLSPDAAPALRAALPRLSAHEQCLVRAELGRELRPPRSVNEHGWQSWSVARARARAVARSLGGPAAPAVCARPPQETTRPAVRR